MTLKTEVAQLAAEIRALAFTVHQQRRLVSMAQAATVLGVSERTVRRLVKTGEIPHVRLGRQVRIDLDLVTPRPGAPANQQEP